MSRNGLCPISVSSIGIRFTVSSAASLTVSFDGVTNTREGGTFTYNSADNLLIYSPLPDYNGKDTLIYFVSDSADVATGFFVIPDTLLFTVNPVNDFPYFYDTDPNFKADTLYVTTLEDSTVSVLAAW